MNWQKNNNKVWVLVLLGWIFYIFFVTSLINFIIYCFNPDWKLINNSLVHSNIWSGRLDSLVGPSIGAIATILAVRQSIKHTEKVNRIDKEEKYRPILHYTVKIKELSKYNSMVDMNTIYFQEADVIKKPMYESDYRRVNISHKLYKYQKEANCGNFPIKRFLFDFEITNYGSYPAIDIHIENEGGKIKERLYSLKSEEEVKRIFLCGSRTISPYLMIQISYHNIYQSKYIQKLYFNYNDFGNIECIDFVHVSEPEMQIKKYSGRYK